MKVAKLIEKRRAQWQELEQLCAEMSQAKRRSLTATEIARFATLYRAACADLALADSYQLPPNIVEYLHKLVGRAHGQLYRSRNIDWGMLIDMFWRKVPRDVFNDRCVHLSFCIFWAVFLLCGVMASQPDRFPDFAINVTGPEQIDMMEEMYAEDISSRNIGPSAAGAAGYVNHNTGIGIQCFVLGITVIGGLYVLLYNAAMLGTVFGHMASPHVPETTSEHFFEFVTAHGPFELTAIALAAGAGLRIGFTVIRPVHNQGDLAANERPESSIGYFDDARQITFSRLDSLRIGAKHALPIMGASATLFILAAMIEAWVSPSALPLVVKQLMAIFCSGLLMLYFIGLGYPRRPIRATR